MMLPFTGPEKNVLRTTTQDSASFLFHGISAMIRDNRHQSKSTTISVKKAIHQRWSRKGSHKMSMSSSAA